jgi:hypothetical protein
MINTLLKKTEKLLEEPQGIINFIDIDYKLLEDPDDPYTTITRKMVERNFEAILNPFRMWLQSKKTDYIRQKDWGGLFQYQLNDRVRLHPNNEETVRELIVSQAEEKFPELSIIDCKVEADVPNRNWKVDIIVQDKYSNGIGQIKENISAGDE